MKLKWLAVVLVMTLLATMLVGCQTKTSDTSQSTNTEATKSEEQSTTTDAKATEKEEVPKETTTVVFWGGIPIEAGPQDVIDNFNAEFKDKGIQVEYERYVNDEQGNLKLETSLLAGNEIDVYMTYGNFKTHKRADGGMALDLSTLIERDGFPYEADFGDVVKTGYKDGKPFSLFTIIGKFGILVNKDMFEEAGIPLPTKWTYDEFREIAAKLTHGEGQDKVYGMFFNTQQHLSEYWGYFAHQTLGADWMYTPDGSATNFDNDVIVKTLDLVKNVMEDGSAPTHVDSVTQKLTQESMFISGKSAMTIGSWIIRSVKNVVDYPHDFKTAYVPFPIVAEDQQNFVQGGVGDEICINPKSENLDAAWEFVKWYSTEGVKYMAKGGRIGLNNNIDKDEMLAIFGAGAEELIDLESAKSIIFIKPEDKISIPVITTKQPEIIKILSEEVEAVFLGQKDTSEALLEAKSRADELLK